MFDFKMQENLLDKINCPEDLKALSVKELKLYAENARSFITETVLRQGGHLSSNLGAVEFSIALHYVFDSPKDKIVWDVGHQAYTHKLITGRKKPLEKLRENGGAGGFPNAGESVHDSFVSGHSSTSLSAALGMARARDLDGANHNIIAVIGDGALTGGMAYEALSDIGSQKSKLIIILNDNEMSISKNVGAMSEYLSKLRLSKKYSNAKRAIKNGINALPFFGSRIMRLLEKSRAAAKSVFIANKMFEQMGIRYYGPLDGHDIKNLIETFESVKHDDFPVIIHLLTNKGNGYKPAEDNPGLYHGVTPGGAKSLSSFSAVAGETLSALAKVNPKIVAVTAAMCDGTGLKDFADKFADRYFDVGIAEQHAVTMCAGLAKEGYKPYFAVYSSFLQRGYDQLCHDVAIMNLPVTFLIDRAGVIGADGVTHQGIFDIAYLKMLPNFTVLAPKDGEELRAMLQWSAVFNGPLAVRYPKGYEKELGFTQAFEYGKWETLKKSVTNIFVLCAGNRMLCAALKTNGAQIVNARFIKPLDFNFLDDINREGNTVITLEDGVLCAGFGQSVLSYLNTAGLKAKVITLGLKDSFITNLDIDAVFAENGLTSVNIQKIIDKI